MRTTSRRRSLMTIGAIGAAVALTAACTGAPPPSGNTGSATAKTSDFTVDTPAPKSDAGDVVWASIEVPHCDPIAAPIVYSASIQLLAYYVAVQKGTDVDQPRNLAKSVTVE